MRKIKRERAKEKKADEESLVNNSKIKLLKNDNKNQS
jgi:hypothetical protein